MIENGAGNVSPRAAARIAGWGYLAIFVLAVFANFFVRANLIEPNDAAATASNVLDSEALFRSGMGAFLVVFALDVLIAWALYVVFRGVSRDLSLLAAWFRLAYTVLLGVALVGFFAVLEVVSGDGYADAFGDAGRDGLVRLFADAFDAAWLIGLVLFGAHLVVLGFLVARSSFMPRVLGWILGIAGVAYVVDTFANTFLANYDDVETVFLVIVALPSVVGELWLTLWLLLRGGRTLDPSAATSPARAAPREVVAS
jgi:hypothetical protein